MQQEEKLQDELRHAEEKKKQRETEKKKVEEEERRKKEQQTVKWKAAPSNLTDKPKEQKVVVFRARRRLGSEQKLRRERERE